VDDDLTSPTVRRRRLAAELRALRETLNRSGDTVAGQLGWSPSKISRYERAKTGLKPKEVERLLDYYKVRGEKRAALLALAEDAQQKGWWEEYASSLPEAYQEYVGLEHEASQISIWHVDVVPGLLQTEGYARHIITSYGKVEPVTPSAIGRLVRVRMRRQQVLDRDGLQVFLVLDESILRRRIGSPAVMYEQLSRLAVESKRENVDIRVLRLDAQHTVFGESFVIFGFSIDGDASLQDVVSTEQLRSGFILEGERDTYLHRLAFEALSRSAMSREASRELILRTAEELWAGEGRIDLGPQPWGWELHGRRQ
jgi:transcriptional regulator with XRE-family HTH domain